MYTIEKGVPIPVKKSGWHTIPFSDMEIGDSIGFPLTGKKDQIKKLRCNFQNWRKRHDLTRRFTLRVLEEENEVRIWRKA